MAKLVASITESCDGRVIELRLGKSLIETLYVRYQSYSNDKFQVEQIIKNYGCISDIQDIFRVDGDNPKNMKRIVSDNELNDTEIMLVDFEVEILYKGTEKQCIRYAKKWLEDEYSINKEKA